MTPFQRTVELVSSLDAGDRKKLGLLLSKFAGKPSGGIAPRPSLEADWLLTGILSELSRRGLVYRSRGGPDVRRLAPNYEIDSSIVRDQLKQLLRVSIPQPKQVELLKLGSVSARALADYLEPVTAVGLKVLLNNAGKTLEALDRSFPGYLRSGMIYCLVQQSL